MLRHAQMHTARRSIEVLGSEGGTTLDPEDEAAIEILEELPDSLPEVEQMIKSEAWTTLEGAIYHLSMDVALRYAAPTPQGATEGVPAS